MWQVEGVAGRGRSGKRFPRQGESARRLPMCKVGVGVGEQMGRLDRQVSDLGLVLFG